MNRFHIRSIEEYRRLKSEADSVRVSLEDYIAMIS